MTDSIKNIIALAVLVLVTSCNSRQPSQPAAIASDSLSTPRDIEVIVGIGKVEPLDGVIQLAASSGGIVRTVLRHEGDTVSAGDAIFTLQSDDASLKISKIKAQIATEQQQIVANQTAIGQYEAQLNNKSANLEAGRRLAKSGAETQQNIASQATEIDVLNNQIEQGRQAAAVSRARLNELQADLRLAESDLGSLTIRTPSDGTLLSLDAQPGSAIQPLQAYADFAPKGPLVVHGEVDELFAQRLALGQEASIHLLGDKQAIASGRIIYLSPQLNNKSLFTDMPGEAQDRRVRRFKVRIDPSDRPLLLNTKVECEIHLKNK